MFPADWGVCSAQGRKRSRTFSEQVDEGIFDSVPEGKAVQFVSDIKTIIEKELYKPPTQACLSELCVDHVLSRAPYKNILENLFSGVAATPTPELPVISRVFEERYMRQAGPQENSCAMGSQCECMFIDRNQPFIGVEFRLARDPPGSPQMCVLCSRKTTQKLFYDMCYTGQAPKCIIQRFGNIFGQAGEYSPDCMLACPHEIGLQCMPLPIMSHQRNRYSVSTVGGTKILKQHRVFFERDFCLPSETRQH